MKSITLLFIMLFLSNRMYSQVNAETVARKIATKMADTLHLSIEDREKIFSVNMDIAMQKQAARKEFKDENIIGKAIQKIESQRDSIYRVILGNTLYDVYILKKKNLVNNN